MPWGDGTGPWGQGPGTGLGLGYCNGYDRPGYANPLNRGGGRGYGYGRGWGRGFRRGYRAFYPAYYPYSPYVNQPQNIQSYRYGDEKEYLKNYLKDIEQEQQYIKKRLDELAKQEQEKED